jgi:hypothetical protein
MTLIGKVLGTSRETTLFGEEVVEGFHGFEFVVADIEDGVKLGDIEDVVNLFAEIEEFEFAAGVADGGEAADEFADAGAVDVIDVGEVENDFRLAASQKIADGGAERVGFVAEDDAATDVEQDDVIDFAGGNGQVHDGRCACGNGSGWRRGKSNGCARRAVVQLETEASQTRDYRGAENAPQPAVRPDPSRRKRGSLRMTSKLQHYLLAG